MRLRYPGSCSLEFQNTLEILIEELLQWDIKKGKSKGPGVLGDLIAFTGAIEEQGRKTLHIHLQFYVKNIQQKDRNNLFHPNSDKRKAARKKFCDYVDKVMSAQYCDGMVNKCIQCNGQFNQVDEQIVRNARIKTICNDIKGKLLECSKCGMEASPADMIDFSLRRWEDFALTDLSRRGRVRCINKKPDDFDLLDRQILDIAAMTYSYHMPGGSNESTDWMFGNPRIRKLLLTLRFDEHAFKHTHSCFKKDCTCRFFLPQGYCSKTQLFEDYGEDNDNVVEWHLLEAGCVRRVPPWMILPKRPMGCQYVNSHSDAIQEVFNCNTNVQLGDPCSIFYNTLYKAKNTQDEDSEKVLRIQEKVTALLVRLESELQAGLREPLEEDDFFRQGLCRLLSGIQASTSRYVVSATLAHFLIGNNGKRFIYSHNFGHLLICQMDSILDGGEIDCQMRRVKTDDDDDHEVEVWADVSSYDYLFRPEESKFENMCSYEMCIGYRNRRKGAKQIKEMKNFLDHGIYPPHLEQFHKLHRHSFSRNHPSFTFVDLEERRRSVIPITFIPKNKLCCLADLCLDDLDVDVDEVTVICRENYAKMALLMFYPFRKLSDLMTDFSYWKLFKNELDKHRNHSETKFWKEGFTILQNMEDRAFLTKSLTRARDPISLKTKKSEIESESTKKVRTFVDERDLPNLEDYCDQDE